MTEPSPIFVAGTGRSGTSQLADILGEHPQIHRIPIETHFIVDPGGLRDLADALTTRYDPFVGKDALRRLRDIVTVRLHARPDDRGHTVPEAIGERHYWGALERLCPDLVAAAYDKPAPVPAAAPPTAGRPPAPSDRQTRQRVVAKYFSDRSELLQILRRTVETMFSGSRRRPKGDLVREDAVQPVVHGLPVGAHPDGHHRAHQTSPTAVVAAHLDQPWAPPTVDAALAWLKPIYERWLVYKASTDLSGRRYVEVEAEDLAADWPTQRRHLFERLGVDDHVTESTFEPQILDRRKRQFDSTTRQLVQRTLGDLIPAMGYA